MAVKTANVSVRVEPSIKEEAENVLDRLGISSSTVINMLYRQIIMLQGIPFQATIPAPLTREEMDDACPAVPDLGEELPCDGETGFPVET